MKLIKLIKRYIYRSSYIRMVYMVQSYAFDAYTYGHMHDQESALTDSNEPSHQLRRARWVNVHYHSAAALRDNITEHVELMNTHKHTMLSLSAPHISW